VQIAKAYYNEIDPYAAQWLRNLIDGGHIASGTVDERSITDVSAADLKGFTQCHFFAGIGGWSVALRLAGWPDDRSVWTGSCPCQPFSLAGLQAGQDDTRHLWPIWFDLISKHRPPVVFGEQVASAVAQGWLDELAVDMEGQNYAIAAAVLPASGVGALHRRDRLWFVADAFSSRSQGVRTPAQEPWSWEQFERLLSAETRLAIPAGQDRALADGIPGRMGQLRAYGNAIVPQVAAEFIGAYMTTVSPALTAQI
jgi:DNA (cytosine-5)-methyltransferase 1